MATLIAAENLQPGDRIRHSFGGPERTYVVVSAQLGSCAVPDEEYAVERVRVKMNEDGKPEGKYGPHASTGYMPGELVEMA